MVSAPVLFHLEYDRSLYKEIAKGKVSVDSVAYDKVYESVLCGPGLEKTKELQKKHTAAAVKALENFSASDARTALENIILTKQSFS